VPLAGETGPTTAMYLTIRSAQRDRLFKADFDYPDGLPSRCSQFEVIHAGQDSTPHKIAMIKAPHVGEKAYALMVLSDAATAVVGSVACASCPERFP
jgi:hypothetical protein